MSPQDSSKGLSREKPRTNIYTMMLILSLISIITACVLLYLELQSYGSYPWWNAR